mgnify:CR=1 FL=1
MIEDLVIHLAAFQWLSQQTDIHGDVLPRSLLQSGFKFGDDQIPLLYPMNGHFRVLTNPSTLPLVDRHDTGYGLDCN